MLVFLVGGLVVTATAEPGIALPERAWRFGEPSAVDPVGPTDWERPPMNKPTIYKLIYYVHYNDYKPFVVCLATFLGLLWGLPF